MNDGNVLYYLSGAYILGAIMIKGFAVYILWERFKIRKNLEHI